MAIFRAISLLYKMKKKLLILLSLTIFFGCQTNPTQDKNYAIMSNKLEKVTFGGGCFWCVEACFSMLKGVYKVTSGYAGGHLEYPTYEQVCTGKTGHAEVVQIEYDPEEISFSEILDVFWFLHDPTQKDRQGDDIGTQYRSVIFYRTEQQKIVAIESMKKSEKSNLWKGEYQTEITKFTNFYPAEDYHQGYYASNPNKPYCSAVVGPKIQKFKTKFNYKLKTEFKPK